MIQDRKKAGPRSARAGRKCVVPQREPAWGKREGERKARDTVEYRGGEGDGRSQDGREGGKRGRKKR